MTMTYSRARTRLTELAEQVRAANIGLDTAQQQVKTLYENMKNMKANNDEFFAELLQASQDNAYPRADEQQNNAEYIQEDAIRAAQRAEAILAAWPRG